MPPFSLRWWQRAGGGLKVVVKAQRRDIQSLVVHTDVLTGRVRGKARGQRRETGLGLHGFGLVSTDAAADEGDLPQIQAFIHRVGLRADTS